MAGTNGWRIEGTISDWMRAIEKRVLNVERRYVPNSAHDLLGPGLGPHAVPLADLNDPKAAFNGIFHVHIDVPNSPDINYGWMVLTMSSLDRYGIQIAYAVHDRAGALVGAGAPVNRIRRFFSPGGATPRVYGTWTTL